MQSPKVSTDSPAPHLAGPVSWYRSPVPAGTLTDLHRRSDWLGGLQTVGYLGLLIATGAAAFFAAGRLPAWAVVAIVFAHGTCCAFLVNAIHELCHGAVFKTRFLNAFFLKIFGFFGWSNNFEMFWASHQRHHRYTLHPPDDLEVVLPMRLVAKHFLLQGFVDPVLAWRTFKKTLRVARGRMEGEWELALYPDSVPKARKAAVRWARVLIVGHGLILAFSVYKRLWLLPVVTTFAPFYGGWLFFLCNSAQHIGLQDNVPDFRLCCRTITLNPVVQFLYWHMNYHTEHHMYAAVPCYRLGRLHRLIREDLPECPSGIVATWRQIAEIQRKQEADPTYQYAAPLPSSRTAQSPRPTVSTSGRKAG